MEGERSQKLRFNAHIKYIEVFLISFFLSSFSHNWAISARNNALKIQQKVYNSMVPWQQQSQ